MWFVVADTNNTVVANSYQFIVCGQIYGNTTTAKEAGAQIWASAGSNFIISGSTYIAGEVAFDMSLNANAHLQLNQSNARARPLIYAKDWTSNCDEDNYGDYSIDVRLINLHQVNGGNLDGYYCCAVYGGRGTAADDAFYWADGEYWGESESTYTIQGRIYECAVSYDNLNNYIITFGSSGISEDGAVYTLTNNSTKTITYSINGNASVSLAASGSVEIALTSSDYITITATLNGSLILMGSTMYQGIYVNGSLLVENGAQSSVSKSGTIYVSNLSSTTIDITIDVK